MQSLWLLVVSAIACGHLSLVEGKCETPWQDCGSTGLKVNNVIVQDCCANPCKVELGKSTLFSFTFTPTNTYQNLTQEACGDLAGSCVQFPDETFGNMCGCTVQGSEPCTLSKPCPFEAGTMYNMSVEVPLATTFPKFKTVAEWHIYDPKQGTTLIGCFEVPVQTV